MNNERAIFNQALELSWVRGRAAHAGIDLSELVFRERIQSVVLKDPESLSSWQAAAELALSLHVCDLYLATACAHNNDIAWQRLRSAYVKVLSGCFYYGSVSSATASESPGDMAGDLLSDLFLPDGSGRSRIATYDGRSSLSTWLRVIAAHRKVNEKLKKRYEYYVLDAIPEPRDTTTAARFDSALRNGDLETATISAFLRACALLSDAERQLLMSRYNSNVPLGRIAERMGVHQCTVTRQIERICRRVRRELEAILAAEHGMSAGAIEDCIEMLKHQDDAGFVWRALGDGAPEQKVTAPQGHSASSASPDRHFFTRLRTQM